MYLYICLCVYMTGNLNTPAGHHEEGFTNLEVGRSIVEAFFLFGKGLAME